MTNEKDIFYITITPNLIDSINLNWHSIYDDLILEYSTIDDSSFQNKKTILPIKKEWAIDGFPKRFVYHCEVVNLNPNQTYIGRIKNDKINSDLLYFKTNKEKEFSFLGFCDFQCYPNNITHPLINLMKQKVAKGSLAICSGDLIDTAGIENEWEWLFKEESFKDILFSSTVGDHEYWLTDLPRVTYFERPEVYNQIFNNPKNGIISNTNYYFYYGNILFVFLDNDNSNKSTGPLFSQQVMWLKEALTELKNSYDYLIVVNHKSIYGSKEIDKAVRQNITDVFQPIFDEFGVDLVMSGHDHVYSRTYPLYNNKRKEEGTTYLDLGSSGNKYRHPSLDLREDGLHEKAIDLKEKQYALGALFNVKRELIQVLIYNQHDEIVDEFMIKRKYHK